MSDIKLKLRTDVEYTTRLHSEAELRFKAAQMELEFTKEALVIALMRENNFLQTGSVLTDEQIMKLRYRL